MTMPSRITIEAREREIAAIDVKAIWRAHGGAQHGPHVEQYYIEEQAFYRFAKAYRDAILAAFADQRASQGDESVLNAAVEPWADYHGDLPDYDHPLRCVFESGVQYTVELLAKELEVDDYVPCDGTEEFDGDLGGTLLNIIKAAGSTDEHGDYIPPRELRARASQGERVDDGGGAFQARVQPWMMECFGAEISADMLERCDRFTEESMELVQSLGYSQERAHALVDYVFARDIGEPSQEVGGVMVTLAALCLASGLDMHANGETELARINRPEIISKIRAKQAAKPTGSALPVAAPIPSTDREGV